MGSLYTRYTVVGVDGVRQGAVKQLSHSGAAYLLRFSSGAQRSESETPQIILPVLLVDATMN